MGGATQFLLLLLLGWLSVDSGSHQRFHAHLGLRHPSVSDHLPTSDRSPATPAPDTGDACPITLFALGHLEPQTAQADCEPRLVVARDVPAPPSSRLTLSPRWRFPFACGPPTATI